MRGGVKYFEDWCLDVRAGGVDPDDTDFFLGMVSNLKHQYYYYITLSRALVCLHVQSYHPHEEVTVFL